MRKNQCRDKRGLLAASLAVAIALWPPVASAQQPSTPKTAFRLVTLGTAGGPISATRAQPATLLTVNGVNYLFDAGNGVARQLLLAGVPIGGVDKIFITHNHDDHNADWGALMGFAWSGGHYDVMDVYGPPGTESMLAGYLQYFAPNVADRSFAVAKRPSPADVFRAHDIKQDGLVYQDANIKVTARENCHFKFQPGDAGYNWQTSFAFRIDTPSRSIVMSGDTGECIDQLADFAKGASILMHEVVAGAGTRAGGPAPATRAGGPAPTAGAPGLPAALAARGGGVMVGHTGPEDIGKLAAKAGVGMVVLHHFLGGANQPESAFTDGVKLHFKGPVIAAKDLQEFN